MTLAEDQPRSGRRQQRGPVLRLPGRDKNSLLQVIEHVFKEDEDPSAGFPVTREKEFKVRATTRLAIVTISGFEVWFGSPEVEYMFARSREGVNTALEADLAHGTLTVKVCATLALEPG